MIGSSVAKRRSATRASSSDCVRQFKKLISPHWCSPLLQLIDLRTFAFVLLIFLAKRIPFSCFCKCRFALVADDLPLVLFHLALLYLSRHLADLSYTLPLNLGSRYWSWPVQLDFPSGYLHFEQDIKNNCCSIYS